mmetsp:Transcript_3778/g.5713  ORF Transcript_3778/g.5713 Transcript_3778/m.5713 type:complete len:105 (+) Transcript_3778:186-500(+)
MASQKKRKQTEDTPRESKKAKLTTKRQSSAPKAGETSQQQAALTYQMGTGIHVYIRVQSLFGQHEDIFREFKHFLPDNYLDGHSGRSNGGGSRHEEEECIGPAG